MTTDPVVKEGRDLLARASNGPCYAEEGTPHVYQDWAGRKVKLVTVHVPDWHEDRLCGGREAFANAQLAAFAFTHLPSLLDRIERAEKALEKMAFYAALLVDPKAHGTFYPDKAMAELEEARALVNGGDQ